MIKILKETFISNTRALEILYVLEGLKPVTRMSFSENYVPVVREFCRRNDLAFEQSDFKVMMEFRGSYSTKGTIMPADSPVAGHFFVYISFEEDLARRAKQAEKKQDIEEYGRLLGYPACCVNFFKKNKPIEEKRNNDYIIPALKQSKGIRFPYYINIFGRHFDKVLLNHSPCSFNCGKSIELARKHEEIITAHDSSLAKRIALFLKSAVIYNGAVYILHNYLYQNNTIKFLNVHSTAKDSFSELLRKNRSIELGGGIEIGSERFSYPLLLFE